MGETSGGTDLRCDPLLLKAPAQKTESGTSPKVGVPTSSWIFAFISFTFSKFLRTSLKVLGSIF